jgi:import inner membrane translocase subunit TIM17
MNAPKRQRFMSGIRHIRNRSALLGGSFAMWGGIFSFTDCALISIRKKDDPYNAIMAGTITGGVLAIRGGISVAFKQALAGGFILAMIEGVGIIFQQVAMRRQMEFMKEMQA